MVVAYQIDRGGSRRDGAISCPQCRQTREIGWIANGLLPVRLYLDSPAAFATSALKASPRSL